jgi:Skp family chaperone for outer membrane proteins
MKTTIATILVLFAAALHALAAETTFAIVDLNAVFIGYSKTKSAEAEIVRLRSQAKNELARLEKTGDAAAVSEFRKTSEAKLQKDFVSLRDPIIKDIVAAVSAVQVEQKIDYVFDSNAKSISGVPTMFALSGTARDITSLVSSKLNSGANQKH